MDDFKLCPMNMKFIEKKSSSQFGAFFDNHFHEENHHEILHSSRVIKSMKISQAL